MTDEELSNVQMLYVQEKSMLIIDFRKPYICNIEQIR